MTSGTRFTRRTAIATASAIGAGILARAPSTLAARRKVEETWESENGSLSVTYDPDVWFDLNHATPDTPAITLATDPEFNNPRYWLNISQFETTWSTIDDAAANAQAEWFSQGMNGSIVTEEFTTDDGYGWIHYADFQGNPRTVSVFQYTLDAEGQWAFVGISIGVEAFEELDIDDLFDAVSLNDDSVFVIASQRTMIRAIEDAFTA